MKKTGHIAGEHFCKRAECNGLCWLLKDTCQTEKSPGGADGSGVCGGGDRLCSSFNNAMSTRGVIKCEIWESTLILNYKSDIIWEKE